MPYTPLSSEAVKLLDKESPVFKRFRLGTWLQNLLTAVATVAGTETLTNKTLTAPTVNGGTIANATVNGGTINSPVIASPDVVQASASHDYGGAAEAWELSAAEMKAGILIATNASGAVDAVALPTAGKVYIVVNTSGQALTIKAAGQTGITIASTKTAIVRGNGTDFVRVTDDA
jgi:hypothetical protein